MRFARTVAFSPEKYLHYCGTYHHYSDEQIYSITTVSIRAYVLNSTTDQPESIIALKWFALFSYCDTAVCLLNAFAPHGVSHGRWLHMTSCSGMPILIKNYFSICTLQT